MTAQAVQGEEQTPRCLPDISTLQRRGHFYFALTRARFWLKRAMKHGNAGGELLETVEKQLATAQRNGPETTPRK